jgi:hypothetical protein
VTQQTQCPIHQSSNTHLSILHLRTLVNTSSHDILHVVVRSGQLQRQPKQRQHTHRHTGRSNLPSSLDNHHLRTSSLCRASHTLCPARCGSASARGRRGSRRRGSSSSHRRRILTSADKREAKVLAVQVVGVCLNTLTLPGIALERWQCLTVRRDVGRIAGEARAGVRQGSLKRNKNTLANDFLSYAD